MSVMSVTKPTDSSRRPRAFHSSEPRRSFGFASRAACAAAAAVAMLAACTTPRGPTSAAAHRPAASAAAALSFAWPARGPILKQAAGAKHAGINIGGTAGEPVRAAERGVVAYAGDSLRGYGNFVIIKHDDTYLSAYAHNRKLLVKEGDPVAKGQVIAEMGDSDADRVMLHFEIRRKGVAVDPLKYLPAR